MSETRVVTPNLKTLANILAPDCPESTILTEQAGLTLPGGFILTDFDRLVFNVLYRTGSRQSVQSALEDGFARNGVEVEVNHHVLTDYLRILRGQFAYKSGDREVWSGSLPAMRAGYNAMRILETGVCADHKRDLQYVAATILSKGSAGSEVAKALAICSPAPLVDMMILDLSETSLDELNELMQDCVDSYKNRWVRPTDLQPFMDDFKAGYVLVKTPVVHTYFHRLVNEEISKLWLDKLTLNPEWFRAEDMEYVCQSLEVFAKAFALPRSRKKDFEFGQVNDWMRRKYRSSITSLGGSVVRVVMGLDFDGSDVVEMADQGYEYLKTS